VTSVDRPDALSGEVVAASQISTGRKPRIRSLTSGHPRSGVTDFPSVSNTSKGGSMTASSSPVELAGFVSDTDPDVLDSDELDRFDRAVVELQAWIDARRVRATTRHTTTWCTKAAGSST
jgi:hypothetical protein